MLMVLGGGEGGMEVWERGRTHWRGELDGDGCADALVFGRPAVNVCVFMCIGLLRMKCVCVFYVLGAEVDEMMPFFFSFTHTFTSAFTPTLINVPFLPQIYNCTQHMPKVVLKVLGCKWWWGMALFFADFCPLCLPMHHTHPQYHIYTHTQHTDGGSYIYRAMTIPPPAQPPSRP